MSGQKRERLLPYACEQLFDLAADVERYPEYLYPATG
jgi:ribosome-associated toxin RatA of RatAB toxin-antitoxin module